MFIVIHFDLKFTKWFLQYVIVKIWKASRSCKHFKTHPCSQWYIWTYNRCLHVNLLSLYWYVDVSKSAILTFCRRLWKELNEMLHTPKWLLHLWSLQDILSNNEQYTAHCCFQNLSMIARILMWHIAPAYLGFEFKTMIRIVWIIRLK